jgi:parvulin-like peptidyl-prolyl isomerase
MAKKGSKGRKTEQVQRQTKKQIARSRRDARQNRIIMLSMAGLAVIILSVLAFGLIQELVIKPNRPVATVNGNKIPSDLFQDLVTYYRYNQYVTISNLQQGLEELQNSPEDNEFLISFYEQQLTQLESELDMIPDMALEALIEDELIRERAEEENITVTQADAAASIESELREALSQSQEPITGTETLPDATPVPQAEVDDFYASILENIQIPKKSFEEIRRRELLRGQLQELLASEVATTGLVVHAQIIQTETEEEAFAARERIEAGEEFSIVAQEVSTDTLSVDAGGDLGWMAEGQVSARYGQALEEAVFGMPVSDELRVLQSDDMFYVIQILERDENGPLPESVLSERQNSALTDWLEERKNAPDVTIERLLEEDQIPADPFTRTLQYFEQ